MASQSSQSNSLDTGTLCPAPRWLLRTSKDSGAYGTLVTAANRLKDYFSDIFLDEISNRNLSRWVEYERQRGIKDITIRLWSRQFNKICRNAKRLGYYTPLYEWCEWNIKDKPIRYLTDEEEQKILSRQLRRPMLHSLP